MNLKTNAAYAHQCQAMAINLIRRIDPKEIAFGDPKKTVLEEIERKRKAIDLIYVNE